jgi:hypothetical protein
VRARHLLALSPVLAVLVAGIALAGSGAADATAPRPAVQRGTHPAPAPRRRPAGAHDLAPLPRALIHRLARRARLLHRTDSAAAYAAFLRLARRWRASHRRPRPREVVHSIRFAASRFGLSPAGMLAVARCESGLRRAAENGQYRGLFQLGDYARARYLRGDWRDSYANALAAARYARDAGGFSPWTCGYAYGERSTR